MTLREIFAFLLPYNETSDGYNPISSAKNEISFGSCDLAITISLKQTLKINKNKKLKKNRLTLALVLLSLTVKLLIPNPF